MAGAVGVVSEDVSGVCIFAVVGGGRTFGLMSSLPQSGMVIGGPHQDMYVQKRGEESN